jgi:chemotaxis protein methyltransferase CheR
LTQVSALSHARPVNEPVAAEATVSFPVMRKSDFEFLRNFAAQHAGLHIATHKTSMVHRRVSRRVAALGYTSFAAYCDFLQSTESGRETEFLINALTTNKTDFFRENHHFDHLRTVILPELHAELRKNPNQRVRIWSAGCSSGQEAYSIAMTILVAIPDANRLNIKVLATDIDTDILATAAAGVYPRDEVAGIAGILESNCFQPVQGKPELMRIAKPIRDLVTFNQLNLHGSWPMSGPIDVVFCRNVVIYFDKQMQSKLFGRIADIMPAEGTLYIGHSESLFRVSDRFKFEGHSIYRKLK